LLAALRQPGPPRDVYQQESGRYIVSYDLFPVRVAVVREAIDACAIVETYPGRDAPYWRLPELVEKRSRHPCQKRQAQRRPRGLPRKGPV